jgi:hypothetical protein
MCVKLFHLDRKKDVSGVSGVSDNIASGVVFDDGQVVIHWNTACASIAIYKSLSDLEAIHGHEGCTKIVFDEPAGTNEMKKENKGNGN